MVETELQNFKRTTYSPLLQQFKEQEIEIERLRKVVMNKAILVHEVTSAIPELKRYSELIGIARRLEWAISEAGK